MQKRRPLEVSFVAPRSTRTPTRAQVPETSPLKTGRRVSRHSTLLPGVRLDRPGRERGPPTLLGNAPQLRQSQHAQVAESLVYDDAAQHPRPGARDAKFVRTERLGNTTEPGQRRAFQLCVQASCRAGTHFILSWLYFSTVGSLFVAAAAVTAFPAPCCPHPLVCASPATWRVTACSAGLPPVRAAASLGSSGSTTRCLAATCAAGCATCSGHAAALLLGGSTTTSSSSMRSSRLRRASMRSALEMRSATR